MDAECNFWTLQKLEANQNPILWRTFGVHQHRNQFGRPSTIDNNKLNNSMPGTLDKTDDVLLLLLAVQLLDSQFSDLIDCHDSPLARHIREQRRLNRSLLVEKTRLSWTQFTARVSDSHFRRMFRMDESVFNKLCCLVSQQIGEEVFCPEAHLLEKKGGDESDLRRISGEVKMAISVRTLAGGSYLDLVPSFVVSSSHSCDIFTRFLHWIISAFEFPLVSWLRKRQWDPLHSLANSFAEKSSGVFHGPFGSLDGPAVRIESPMNVQAIAAAGRGSMP